MSDKHPDNADAKHLPENNERREALVKLGKYAAYTAPAMLVTTNAKRAFAQAAPGTPAGTTTGTTTVAPVSTLV